MYMTSINNQIQLSELRSLHITTKPSLFRLSNGKTGVAWKATRLTFKRKGVGLLKKQDELIINEISPNSDKDGYIAGYFILTLRQFHDNFHNVVDSDSYKSKDGIYNPRIPPASMKQFFIAN